MIFGQRILGQHTEVPSIKEKIDKLNFLKFKTSLRKEH